MLLNMGRITRLSGLSKAVLFGISIVLLFSFFGIGLAEEPLKPLQMDPKASLETAKEAARVAETNNDRGPVDTANWQQSSTVIYNRMFERYIAVLMQVAKEIGEQSQMDFQSAMENGKLKEILNKFLTHSGSSSFSAIAQAVPWQMTRFMIWGSTGIDSSAFLNNQEASRELMNSQIGEAVGALYDALMQAAGQSSPSETQAQIEQKVKSVAENLKRRFQMMKERIANDRLSQGDSDLISFYDYTLDEISIAPGDAMKRLKAQTEAKINDVTTALGSMAAKLEDIDRLGGIPGLSGEDKDSSLFIKTRILGVLLLILGFFARIVQMVIGRLVGNSPSNEMKILGTIIKFVVLLILILSVPSFVEVGLDISDSVRSYIMDPKEKMADAGVGEKTVAMLQMIDSMADARQQMLGGAGSISLTEWLGAKLQAGVAWVVYVGIASILIALMTMCDIMMGITGVMAPICFAVSFFPHCSQWFGHIVKGWMGYVFQLPIAALFMQIMVIMMAMTSQVGFVTFLIIGMVYIMSASRIPELSSSLSAAVVTGVVAGIAAMPANAAKGAAAATARVATGGVLGMGAKILAGMARKIFRG